MKKLLAVIFLASGSLALAQSNGPHVLMISVDGMRPDYVTHADEHGLKIPHLRSVLEHGTYADGVTGVLPTITYPSHTTLITGVWPNEHGIIENTTFDPLHTHPGEWYWYFNALKVPTLYQAAKAAHLTTAGMSWPVTVGSPMDWYIGEDNQSEDTDTPQGALVHPSNLKELLGSAVPANATKDEKSAIWVPAMIEKFKPNLMLVHIVQLDHEEHNHGPFSPEANAVLEKIDSQIGGMIEAERKLDPKAKIVIVSDHGFLPVQHSVFPNVLMVQSGLVKLKAGTETRKNPVIASWDAATWMSGGGFFLLQRDPNDKATSDKLTTLLEKLRSDSKYGVERILTHDEIVKSGGMKEAKFFIAMKRGYIASAAYNGPDSSDQSIGGTHGYLPEFPELHSAFMAEGPGIAQRRDLGVIDMRSIAPTVAQMLGVSLPTAKLPALKYKP